MASKKNLIGLEASPQQKDTGMTSPIRRNVIEISNSREAVYRYNLKKDPHRYRGQSPAERYRYDLANGYKCFL
jgi:hypothetical protein